MLYGRVIDAMLMVDTDRGRPWDFGIVAFEREAAALEWSLEEDNGGRSLI